MFRILKKSSKKKSSTIEKKMNELNAPAEEIKVQASLQENIAMSKQLFSDMGFIRFREIENEEQKKPQYFLVFCDGMVDSEIINTNIVRPLIYSIPVENDLQIDSLLSSTIHIGEAKTTDNFRDIIESVTAGDTVLFVEGCSQAAILNSKKFPVRAVDEPDNEKTLVGPREGFNESLVQNLAQVTRRIHTNDFKTKLLTLGKRTRTPVCVCYCDQLVNKNNLEELLNRLDNIDIDGILDTNYITELIRDSRFSPFRSTGYTERPDVVVGKLLEGRIAIFVEGSPMALTVPYLFIENFQSSEDYYLSSYYTSFARLLRISAFLLTVAIPGLYIAFVAFHQEIIPLQLLIQIAMERQNVPLPASVEAFIVLLVFDVLRETGIRMPSNIGQALSIVGALVIGQAAVEASLVAAPMIIVVAATGITGLLVPKLNASIIVFRLLLLLLSTFLGIFGFTIGFSILIIHINNLTSFGTEQTILKGKFRFQEIKDIIVRMPWPLMLKRPSQLTSNYTRQAGGNYND